MSSTTAKPIYRWAPPAHPSSSLQCHLVVTHTVLINNRNNIFFYYTPLYVRCNKYRWDHQFTSVLKPALGHIVLLASHNPHFAPIKRVFYGNEGLQELRQFEPSTPSCPHKVEMRPNHGCEWRRKRNDLPPQANGGRLLLQEKNTSN